MRVKKLIHFFQDLIEILPSSSRDEWQNPPHINRTAPTIILISGFAATDRNLSIIRKRFMKDGYNVLILALDWSSLSDSVRGLYWMAKRLSRLVLELRKGKLSSQAKVYLVAHSTGGLVARYYIQLLGGAHYCDGLVTLGTPHQGVWISLFGVVTHLVVKARILLQLLPISNFVREINRTPLPNDFSVLSLSSPEDLLCPPRRTTLPKSWESRLEVQSKIVAGLSHGDFLVSKRCYAIIIDYLEQESRESELYFQRQG